MQVLEAIFLCLVQSLTEFIPVSSSGHLVLAEKLFDLQVSGFVFDAMLNIGTLAALIIYFWRDIIGLVKAVFFGGPQRQLAWFVVIATIPAVVAGFFLQNLSETTLRSPYVVAFALVALALLM